MKKFLTAFLFLSVLAFPAFAQERPANPKYRDIKDYYDPKAYKYDFSDPYSPGWAGIASVIPGLGQCICDEWGRGLGILAANAGFTVLEFFEGAVLLYSIAATTPNPVSGLLPGNMVASSALLAVTAGASVITLAGHAAFNIWNICDAVKVAKVKNMYYKDVDLVPSLALVPSAGSLQPAPGLGIRLTF